MPFPIPVDRLIHIGLCSLTEQINDLTFLLSSFALSYPGIAQSLCVDPDVLQAQDLHVDSVWYCTSYDGIRILFYCVDWAQ